MSDNDEAISPPAGDDAAERAARFWSAGAGVEVLADAAPYGNENALQKLGRPPFEKSARSKFRLLGFLATVYEHVSGDLDGNNADDTATETSEGTDEPTQ